MVEDKDIKRLAQRAGMPPGWYEGPYFEGNGLKTGLPPCLIAFVRLIEAAVKKETRPSRS